MKTFSSDIKRKVIHILGGFGFILLLYFHLLHWLFLGTIILITLLVFLFAKNTPLVRWYVSHFEREHDIPGQGLIFYLLGVEITIILFSRDIALASIAILALGDSIPSLLGKYSKIKHPLSKRKYLEAALIGMILAFIAGSFFVVWYEALLASLIALIVEGLDLQVGKQKIDDNLLIPIVAGATMYVMRSLF